MITTKMLKSQQGAHWTDIFMQMLRPNTNKEMVSFIVKVRQPLSVLNMLNVRQCIAGLWRKNVEQQQVFVRKNVEQQPVFCGKNAEYAYCPQWIG